MAGRVFPESMNKIDTEDTPGSLKAIEAYINYMVERTEFSMKNTMRTAEASGVTNAAVLVMISSLTNSLSALQATVNQQGGEITGMKGTLSSLQEASNNHASDITSIQESINKLMQSTGANAEALAQAKIDIKAMQDAVGDLTKRVENLESTGGDDTGGTT